MMLAASSASGSWQYLLASTRQASASCTFGNQTAFGRTGRLKRFRLVWAFECVEFGLWSDYVYGHWMFVSCEIVLFC